MEITLSIKGQELKILGKQPNLYHGSIGVLYIKFCDVNFDTTLVKTVRFKTEESDWYTADVVDGRVRVPHEVIVVGGFDVAVGGYETADGELLRFLPTNSVHIDVLENGYGEPDSPLIVEGESESVIGQIEKKADIEYVKKFVPQTTVKGAFVKIGDAISGETAVNYKVYGNSKQTVRSGKNLYDETKKPVSGYYYDGSGEPSLANARFLRIPPIQCSPNTTYTLSSNLEIYTIWQFAGENALVAHTINSDNVATFITQKNCDSVRITLRNTSGMEDVSAFEFLQLEVGGQKTEYEKYGMTPAPENPSEILSVGDDGGGEYNIVIKAEDSSKCEELSIHLSEPLRSCCGCMDIVDFSLKKLERNVNRVYLSADMEWNESSNGYIYTELVPENYIAIPNMGLAALSSNCAPAENGWLMAINQGRAVGFDMMSGNWPFSNKEELIQWLSTRVIYIEYPLLTPKYEYIEMPELTMMPGDEIKFDFMNSVSGCIEVSYYQDINKVIAELKAAHSA